jgi:ankyrin repeat protein
VLLAGGANIHAVTNFGATALHEAAGCGWAPCVIALLAAGADANARVARTALGTPLFAACKGAHLRQDDSPSPEAHTLATVHALLAGGAALDFGDGDKHDTVLSAAVQRGYASVVAALLRAGARVDARNSQGWTPLHTAAFLVDQDRRIAAHTCAQIGAKRGQLRRSVHVAGKQNEPKGIAIAKKFGFPRG